MQPETVPGVPPLERAWSAEISQTNKYWLQGEPMALHSLLTLKTHRGGHNPRTLCTKQQVSGHSEV